MKHKIFLGLVVSLLSVACYDLKPYAANITDKSIMLIDHTADKALVNALRNQLVAAGVMLTNLPTTHSLVVTVDNLTTNERLLASNSFGQGQLYLLQMCVNLKLDANVSQPICSQRRLNKDYNHQLGNLYQEDSAYREIKDELVNLIYYKISIFYAK
jgi:outer membrane lipopolysaccharide assembly protein LptE/RlpB